MGVGRASLGSLRPRWRERPDREPMIDQTAGGGVEVIEGGAVGLEAVAAAEILRNVFQRRLEHREPISEIGQSVRGDDRFARTQPGAPPKAPSLVGTLAV